VSAKAGNSSEIGQKIHKKITVLFSNINRSTKYFSVYMALYWRSWKGCHFF